MANLNFLPKQLQLVEVSKKRVKMLEQLATRIEVGKEQSQDLVQRLVACSSFPPKELSRDKEQTVDG